MSFPCYPKYKASGVDWLGDVPAVAGTFQVPSASERAFQVPSAESSYPPQRYGTRSVPTTSEDLR
jgi:hypothetical protein